MHNNIRYAGPNAELDALHDLCEWFGLKRFSVACREFGARKLEFEQFAFYASLSGVEGFPVRVWYEVLYGVKP